MISKFFAIFSIIRVINASAISSIRIGTRGSPLALEQAYLTRNAILQSSRSILMPESLSIHKIMTKGDSILNMALTDIGGKGLFTKELDNALLQNDVDICVHSMKDVPTEIPEGTSLPCVMPREITNDVFISSKVDRLEDLPDGSIIGSASLRRRAQLLAINPTWKVVTFRGNVQTRMRKINQGVVDATLLALAGLRRLGMHALIHQSQILPWNLMLPAVAQGAVGIQCRSDDDEMHSLLACIEDESSHVAVSCERAFLRTLEGNCRTPIAAQATLDKDKILFTGMVAVPDGSEIFKVEKVGSKSDATMIGIDAASEIISRIGQDKFAALQREFASC